MDGEELRRQLGQLFIVGFKGLIATDEIKSLIRAPYYIGSIILFARNVDSAEQLIALINDLQQTAKEAGHTRPLFIGIDQENGLVTRIKPPVVAQLPGSMALGATGSIEDARSVSRATGEMLDAMGINFNYAPCCDVNSEPSNPVIGVRSPGDDGRLVGRIASGLASGLRETGIVPCVKHFPGHGDTKVDSHYGLPVVEKSREALEAYELVPFRRAAAEKIEAVMPAHIVLPGIDDSGLPVSVSKRGIALLRQELQHDGLIVTDCLEMDAIRAQYTTEKGAVMAVAAGADCPMICHTYSVQVGAYEGVYNACKDGTIPSDQIASSVGRVDRLKEKFLSWESALKQRSPAVVDELNEKHRKLAKDIYSRSATVVRDDQKALPLPPKDSLVYVYPCEKTMGLSAAGSGQAPVSLPCIPPEIGEILKLHNPNLVECPFSEDSPLDETSKGRISQADAVILATRNAKITPYQQLTGREVAQIAKKLIVIATCDPYDFIDEPDFKTYLAIYEPTPEAFQPAADIIFGATKALGTLPVLTSRPPIQIEPLNATRDMSRVISLWHRALSQYALPADRLPGLLIRPNGAHFTFHMDNKLVGFVATFVNQDLGGYFITAVLVDPDYRSQGIGTALLEHARKYLKNSAGAQYVTLGSVFPRFWPGVPLDLAQETRDFFTHRGFISTPGPPSRDYTTHLKTYEPPASVLERAEKSGIKFVPWSKDLYEECMAKQREIFGDNQIWVDAYERVAQEEQYGQVLVALDDTGKQVGWTMMQELGHGMSVDLALMPLLGEKTGQIGCVGVHPDARCKGVGLALIAHAALDLKRRGMERVFIDWVEHVNWYERAGFEIWKNYRIMFLMEIAE